MARSPGLRGARAFVAAPPVDAASLAINLNMDMIGRDPNDLLYVVGTHTQPFLKPFIERIAAKAPVMLVMGHDDPAQKESRTGPASPITRRSATRRSRVSTSASRISRSITKRPTTSRR